MTAESKIELIEIVMRLTGQINPVGKSNIDEKRFENLKVLCELVNNLVKEIDSVAYLNKDRIEFSRKKAGQYADNFISKTLGIQ